MHAPPDYDCPFCAIVRGADRPGLSTVPSDVVLRKPTTTAWISSRWWVNNPGHVIVVPNAHIETMYDLPRELAADIHDAARLIALAMKDAYGCAGISTRQHNEPAGNQDVWHYHVHVFPRYADDDLYGSLFRETRPEERTHYADRVRRAIEVRAPR